MATTRRKAARDSRTGVSSARGSAGARGRQDRSRQRGSSRKQGKTRKQGGRPPSRQQAAHRRRVAVLSVLTVLGLGYVLLFTPLLGVRSVEVVGARSIAEQRIRAVAEVPPEQPMLRVDTDGIVARVAALSGIADVAVSRSWPSTITVSVRERVAVAFHDAGETLHLVDADGVLFKRVERPPEGLPKLAVPEPGPADAETRAVTTVLASLPRELAERVRVVRAGTPGSVEFVLAEGKIVRWGDAEQNEYKARVLAVLLTRDGKTYDVASPELPTVS